MPDDPKLSTVKFDEAAFNAKVIKLSAIKNAKVGVPNYNPFMWWKNSVQPLIDRFNGGERTSDLQNAMSSVPETIPPIDPNWQPLAKPTPPAALQPPTAAS